jgi:5-methyltetrahydropteroyltriglutamate--homocysteine methyltransferase
MSESAPKPFVRAEQVGSLLRPPKLREARRQRAGRKITDEALQAVEDLCIAEAVRKQEEIGLPVAREVWGAVH